MSSTFIKKSSVFLPIFVLIQFFMCVYPLFAQTGRTNPCTLRIARFCSSCYTDRQISLEKDAVSMSFEKAKAYLSARSYADHIIELAASTATVYVPSSFSVTSAFEPASIPVSRHPFFGAPVIVSLSPSCATISPSFTLVPFTSICPFVGWLISTMYQVAFAAASARAFVSSSHSSTLQMMNGRSKIVSAFNCNFFNHN